VTFTNIALKNVRKKFGSYLIYFFSTTFSIMIFNLFCSLYYNPIFENYRFGTGKMSVLFRGATIAVFLFATIFVLYSGNYFIKMQKKEIAIYSLLGMRKEKIAFMMFLETFFISLLAIVCGTLIGTISSQFFTSMLMRLMAEGTSIPFQMKPKAIIVTIFVFIALFILNGIRAYQTIYKYTLIELLSATKQSEGIPAFSPLGAVASIVLLGVGYVIAITMKVDVGGMQLLFPSLSIIFCVTTGTLFLFRNFIPMVVALLKKRESFYYHTSNFICVSQIAFRLKANSKMLAVVTLLTAITITMVSASYSFYNLIGGDTTECYAPFSYLAKNITKQQHEEILKTVSSIGDVKITLEDKIELFNVMMQNDLYAVKDQQTGEAVPGQSVEAYLMSESMYLKIISETHPLKGSYSEARTDFTGGLNDQTCYFLDGNAVTDYSKKMPGQQINVSFRGESTSYTVNGASQHKYIGALDLYKHPTLVVSDNTYQRYQSMVSADEIDTFYGLQFDDDMKSGSTVDAINQFIPARFHISALPGNMSYIGIYKANFALFGSYVFIGFFLGILFLLASGSVMYYKLIMEAQEEAPRYEILRKTGMKKGEVLSSVAKQLGLIYGIPLFVGLIHTLFALLSYNRMLGTAGQQTPTLQNAAMAVILFVVMYGAFYVLSVMSYQKIIWKRGGGSTNCN
jgi:putative ABC transport system permease protein